MMQKTDNLILGETSSIQLIARIYLTLAQLSELRPARSKLLGFEFVGTMS